MKDPNWKDRGIFTPVHGSDLWRHHYGAGAVQNDGNPTRGQNGCAVLSGYDNESVYRKHLGLSLAELKDLKTGRNNLEL